MEMSKGSKNTNSQKWLNWGNRTGIEKGVGLATVGFHYKPFSTFIFSLLFDKILKYFTKKQMCDRSSFPGSSNHTHNCTGPWVALHIKLSTKEFSGKGIN